MGTNYYARIIPTKERKEKLKELIDSDDFRAIKEEVENLYGNYTDRESSYEDPNVRGIIHLGKRSGGWKFLWNPNITIINNGHLEDTPHGERIYVEDEPTVKYLYPLTKKGIKEFIDREDIKIFDEYNEEQNKEEFFNMAINWTTWRDQEAWDSKSYEEWEKLNNPNHKIYPCTGKYVQMIADEGYNFISSTCSDFYSDGLRFATFNEFS